MHLFSLQSKVGANLSEIPGDWSIDLGYSGRIFAQGAECCRKSFLTIRLSRLIRQMEKGAACTGTAGPPRHYRGSGNPDPRPKLDLGF